MAVLAQAAAEYGALSSGSSGSTSAFMSRIANAGTEEYVIGAIVVLVALVLISKLLDAA
jgi:hypothetical protein